MVFPFINEGADGKSKECIPEREKVELWRGDLTVDNDGSEIFDVNVQWVEVEKHRLVSKRIHGVEYRRHIHKKHSENAPKVLYIAEEYVKCRKNKSYSEVEYYKADDGEDKKEERKREGYSVDYAEYQKDDECKSEVDKCLHVFRKQEEVFRNVYFSKNRSVAEQGTHSAVCGFAEI